MSGGKNIGVIFGGPSEEFAVSRKSAVTVVEGLREAGYHPVPIGITRAGRWYGPVPTEDIITFDDDTDLPEVALLARPGGVIYRIPDFQPLITLDAVFPIIHGKVGEDGRLQGLLDMCRLPYVGCGVSGSAVGMDKVYTRDILKAHGIDQVAYYVLMRHDWRQNPDGVIEKLEAALPYPVYVKPANGGSSIGISRVEDRSELAHALDLATRYDGKIIVEEAVDKREIEVGVLGNNDLKLSCPGEVLEGVFYDYQTKYESQVNNTKVPADLPPATVQKIHGVAEKVFRALDLRGLSRIDFFIEKNTGRLLLNEVNTLPGFTSISMYAAMWRASGIALPQLLDVLVQLAFERKHDNDETITDLGGMPADG